MNFNFSNLGETNFAGASVAHLKPYEIHTVTLTKIERTNLKGSKDPNATYDVVALEFTGVGESKGVFTTNLFVPTTEKDMERPVYENGTAPSRFEEFQYTLMQIVTVLNPDGAEKIKKNGSKITTVDQFIELIIKALKGKENIETKLKLVGSNKNGVVYAALPKACGLTKTGETFPKNFIGDNVEFTAWEQSQMNQYKNAKPTNMSKVEENPDAPTGNDLDITDIDL